MKAEKEGINMIYFLASGIDIDNDLCIKAFEEVLGKDVTIFGATSSDNMKGFISYQAVDNHVTEHGAYVVGFADPSLTVDTQATHGFLAVGEGWQFEVEEVAEGGGVLFEGVLGSFLEGGPAGPGVMGGVMDVAELA
jgi:hypothetical protein